VDILHAEGIATPQTGGRIVRLMQTFQNDRNPTRPEIEHLIEPGSSFRCQKLLKELQILGVVHELIQFSENLIANELFSANLP